MIFCDGRITGQMGKPSVLPIKPLSPVYGWLVTVIYIYSVTHVDTANAPSGPGLIGLSHVRIIQYICA